MKQNHLMDIQYNIFIKKIQNNVNCVLFHPKCDVLISNSEDKT